MHHPTTPLLVLLHGRRPSLLRIQPINLLKNIAVAPPSNTSYCSKQHASTNQQTPTNLIEDLRLLNNDWHEHFDKEKDSWQKQFDKEKDSWQKQVDKEKDSWQKQVDKEKDYWLKQLNEQHKLRLKDAHEIEKLRAKHLLAVDVKLRLQKRYNIRGALERIVAHADDLGLITIQGGVQKRLDELASTQDFQKVLTQVVADRKLVQRDVESCIKHLYHELSKYAHGNQSPIIIPTKDFASNEVAALIAFMRLQDTWLDSLEWEIEEDK